MSSTKSITEKEVQMLIQGKLSRYFGVSPKEATTDQIYKAVVMSVRDILLEKRQQFHKVMKSKKGKRVYYLCMEFLLGRSLKNNIYNLGLNEEYEKALKYFGLTLEDLYEQEPDAGLGNGGLGRLAACFMDALATGNYPAMGYSIRYDYGLFKQKIVDGWQTELPDIWLPGGEVWLTQRSDKSCTVKFDGWVKEEWTENGLKIVYGGYKEVEAVAYDMMISGKDSDAVSVLRLWRARNISRFDMKLFSQGDYLRCMQEENEAEVISKVLYPADDHYEGKSLRLKQQYFLVSASLQNIINDHKHRYGPLSLLPQQAAIHINDTHPALAIPELMRILMDENGFTWDDAWNIATATFAYTNHTVMPEALETWQEDLIARRLPRIHSILKEINRRFCNDLWQRYPGQHSLVESMAIISNGVVRMANLSVVGSHSVNGVSALHSEIIKNELFHGFYQLWPSKFTNVTNGIAHRRWLCQSNPELCELLNDCIGDGYVKDASQLIRFRQFEDDKSVLHRLQEIKKLKKKQFAEYAFKKRGRRHQSGQRFRRTGKAYARIQAPAFKRHEYHFSVRRSQRESEQGNDPADLYLRRKSCSRVSARKTDHQTHLLPCRGHQKGCPYPRKAERRLHGRLQRHDGGKADAFQRSQRTDLPGGQGSERHGQYEIHDQRRHHHRDARRRKR